MSTENAEITLEQESYNKSDLEALLEASGRQVKYWRREAIFWSICLALFFASSIRVIVTTYGDLWMISTLQTVTCSYFAVMIFRAVVEFREDAAERAELRELVQIDGVQVRTTYAVRRVKSEGDSSDSSGPGSLDREDDHGGARDGDVRVLPTDDH
jgi:hypothetical protein